MLKTSSRLGPIGLLWLASAMGPAGAGEVVRVVNFAESKEAIANPERGFYAPQMTHRIGGLEGLRARGITLVLVEMDLRDFKEREITPEKLDELRRAFAAAREHGLKVIFRAAYGFTGRDYRADPRDLDRIRGHIRQLGAVFQAERDVLFCVQAGFLGPWGEWHGSNHGDPPSREARRAVLSGLLAAVPAPIPVQVRRPMFIRDLFPDAPNLTPQLVAEGAPLARVGWHDDALLALPSDMGTFAEPGWDRDRELRWCDNHGRYAPFGGETVPDSARTPVDQVVRELFQFHATYLNSAYHRGTLQGWRQADYRGENAHAHVERRLGYRLVADRLRVSTGETLQVDLDLRNVGFAPPHLPREVAFVLSRGEVRHRVVVESDPRRWLPGEPIHLSCQIKPPPAPGHGPWTISLHLPDPSPRLRDDGRYAIRLGSEGIRFDERTGLNVLLEPVDGL